MQGALPLWGLASFVQSDDFGLSIYQSQMGGRYLNHFSVWLRVYGFSLGKYLRIVAEMLLFGHQMTVFSEDLKLFFFFKKSCRFNSWGLFRHGLQMLKTITRWSSRRWKQKEWWPPRGRGMARAPSGTFIQCKTIRSHSGQEPYLKTALKIWDPALEMLRVPAHRRLRGFIGM